MDSYTLWMGMEQLLQGAMPSNSLLNQLLTVGVGR